LDLRVWTDFQKIIYDCSLDILVVARSTTQTCQETLFNCRKDKESLESMFTQPSLTLWLRLVEATYEKQ